MSKKKIEDINIMNLLSVRQCSILSGYTHQSIYGFVHNGKMEAICIDSMIFIERNELDRFMKSGFDSSGKVSKNIFKYESNIKNMDIDKKIDPPCFFVPKYVNKSLLNIKEAADATGLQVDGILRLIKNGKLDSVVISGLNYIKKEDVDSLINILAMNNG